MFSFDWTWKLIGSAPYLSWSARVFAESAVKLPVICALPLVMAAFDAGAVMTVPSRTIANWFCGACSFTSRLVTSRKSSELLPENVRLTAHWPVDAPCESVARPEVALLMPEPETSTGPRMYFAAPSWSHVTSGSSSGAAVTSSGALQL